MIQSQECKWKHKPSTNTPWDKAEGKVPFYDEAEFMPSWNLAYTLTTLSEFQNYVSMNTYLDDLVDGFFLTGADHGSSK